MWPLLFFVGCSAQTPPENVDPVAEPTAILATPTPVATDAGTAEVNPSLSFRPPAVSKRVPTATPAPTSFAALPPRFNGPPLARTVPSAPVQKPLQSARAGVLQGQIARYGLFAAYRELITLNKNAGLYDEAARLARAQAAQYRSKGLADAAIIADNEAGALESQLRVFVETNAGAVAAAEAGDLVQNAVHQTKFVAV